VIDSLVGDWAVEDFENEYRRDLKVMLDAKLAGEQITRPEPIAETPVVDLMEALRRSVAEVQGAKKPKPKAGSSGGARKKVATRKTA
jgi:non-homologous end joining protein Ku